MPDDELLVRSADVEADAPIPPPLVEAEPERPPDDPEPASERRRLLPLLLPLLEPLVAFTGQLLSSAGFETSPWTIWRSLKASLRAV